MRANQPFIISLLMLAGCSDPCNNHPWTIYLLAPITIFDPHTYRGHDGSSMRNAIVLNGPQGDDQATQAESAYMFHKFKVDTKIPFQQKRDDVGLGQNKYDIIAFTNEEGKRRTLYFDVTSTLQRQAWQIAEGKSGTAFRTPRRFAFTGASRTAARFWSACAPAPLSPVLKTSIQSGTEGLGLLVIRTAVLS
jgi:hypothetical protein